MSASRTAVVREPLHAEMAVLKPEQQNLGQQLELCEWPQIGQSCGAAKGGDGAARNQKWNGGEKANWKSNGDRPVPLCLNHDYIDILKAMQNRWQRWWHHLCNRCSPCVGCGPVGPDSQPGSQLMESGLTSNQGEAASQNVVSHIRTRMWMTGEHIIPGVLVMPLAMVLLKPRAGFQTCLLLKCYEPN